METSAISDGGRRLKTWKTIQSLQEQGCSDLLRKGGEIMDMTAVSAAMSVRQAVTQQAIGTAVTKLAMNQQQQSGQMVVDLLKSASPAGKASLPHLGQNIDISI